MTRKYPLDARAFDGTYEMCRMGVIGKNWSGRPVCSRRRNKD
jgi:hypothetical protein